MWTGIFPMLAQAAAAAPSKAVAVQSLWDFVVKGGILMVPIGFCSLMALAIIVERSVSLRRRNIIPPGFRQAVSAALGTHGNIAGALEYCRCTAAPVARIFAAALERLDEPPERLERHIEQAGEREVLKLQKYLRTLTMIAAIAPLLGLLGTIFGMITAFQTVAASGEALGRTELLAKGIYEALITTAGGLIVAIPVIVAFHALAARVERLVAEMDTLTMEFVESLRPRPKAAERVVRTAERPVSAVAVPGAAGVAREKPNGESVSAGPVEELVQPAV